MMLLLILTDMEFVHLFLAPNSYKMPVLMRMVNKKNIPCHEKFSSLHDSLNNRHWLQMGLANRLFR